MRPKHHCCLPPVVIWALMPCHAASSTTLFVDAGNCPGPGSGSPADPFCSIQDAIDAAVSGVDEVEVAPGTYLEAIDFGGKAIRLLSSDGPEVTTIDGGGAVHVVQCVSGEGPDTVLEGFTITGGDADGLDAPDSAGGGMYNEGTSPTVTDCIFMANSAQDFGGAMYNLGATPAVTGCTFEGNSAGSFGGAMYNGNSHPAVIGCLFLDNSAAAHGGGMYGSGSDPAVTACTFAGNSAGESGGGMYIAGISEPTIVNCVFTGNEATADGGGVLNTFSLSTIVNSTFSGNTAGGTGGAIQTAQAGSLTVTNCVLWGDSPDEIANSSSTLTVTYSDVEDGASGPGNFQIDPKFLDPEGPDGLPGTPDDDLRLDRYSICIDAGNNDGVPLDVTTDLDGDPRFVDDAGVADGGEPGAAGPPVVDMGAYERQDDSAPIVWMVEPGDSIQETISAAVDGDEIFAVAGTYAGPIDFLGKAIALRSVSGPEVTTLDGGGAFHVVEFTQNEGPATVLEGFTITGGNADGLLFPADVGAGLLMIGSGPTVKHCTISGNVTGDISRGLGAGMYCEDAVPTLIGCTFHNNAAFQGGGAYIAFFSSPTLINCVFTDNGALLSGGGMQNELSAPALINCTFTSNLAASVGGGIDNVDADPTVINSILWNNSPSQFTSDADSDPIVAFSDVQGGFPGEGNIDADPMFVDPVNGDLRLAAGSPCIDAGDNTVPHLTLVTEDASGAPRFVDDPETPDTGNPDGINPIIDMGAYEFQPVSTCPGDLDGDGIVGTQDFLELLATWGPCPAPCPPSCPADLDGSCAVGVADFLMLLAAWGPCQ